MNANYKISDLSTEPVYVSFRIENPVLGAEDLSAATVEIAVSRATPKAADWLAATVEPGTWVAPDGETYYVATTTIDGSLLARSTHQIYLRVQHNGFTFVQRAGSVEVY